MANFDKSRGRYRDLPQIEAAVFAALAAGSATDPAAGSETQVAEVPILAESYSGPAAPGQGVLGLLPSNRMWVRRASYVAQGTSATVGNATNNCALLLLVYRFQSAGLPSGSNPGVYNQGVLAYYSLAVNTTLGTAVASGDLGASKVVTPASMANIVPGMLLAIDSAASYELVLVESTTATTFTAVFSQTHTTSAAVTSVLQQRRGTPLVSAAGPVSTTLSSNATAGTSATITPATMYGVHVGDYVTIDTGGSAETVQVQSVTNTTFKATIASNHTSPAPVVTALAADGSGRPRLANGDRFELLPGDVLALTRLSNNVTGLATPAGMLYVDWVPSQIGQ